MLSAPLLVLYMGDLYCTGLRPCLNPTRAWLSGILCPMLKDNTTSQGIVARAIFVARNLFDRLEGFADLETRIAALPTERDRGDAFEVFAERT